MVRSASFKIRPTRLAQTLGLALAALSGSAQALLVTDSITVSGSAIIPGATDTYRQTDATFASDSASISTSFPFASADASSFGRNTGVYGAQVDLFTDRDGSAQAEVHWQRQVTNDGGSALAILLDAYLYGGRIYADPPGGGQSASKTTSYNWNISAVTPGGTITVLNSEAAELADRPG